MSFSPDRLRLAVPSALLAAGALLPLPPAAGAQPFEEQITVDTKHLRIVNLIGEVRIEGHDGANFEIAWRARGEDATRDRIGIERKGGSKETLVVRFPLDETTHYVYPEMGRNSRSTFHWHPDGGHVTMGLKDLLGWGTNRKIEVREHGKGLELWADLVVRVPRGRTLEVVQGCGEILAENVAGSLDLRVKSGSVTAAAVEGDLVADTGSGAIRLRDVTGKVLADTGSGSIHVENVDGDVMTDTGSGDVTVLHARGKRIHADTGSGSVTLNDIACDELNVDTGSGGIEVTAAMIGSGIFDTGSGSVELGLARLTKGPLHVDTGSGSVSLNLPPTPSVHVVAETGSGGIQVDLDGVEWIHSSRSKKAFKVGDGAAKVVLETGSGGIRIGS